MAEQMVLGYWNVRGIAHSIRLLLRVANANFKEELYDEMNFDSWFSVKPTMDLDFPNLPYLIDGDTKLTQSVTILRHLGRKFKMVPETDAEKDRNDLLEMQLLDWRNDLVKLWYLPKDKYEEERVAHEQAVKEKMVRLSKFLGSGPYVLGDKLTYVDFMLYEFLDIQRRFVRGLLEPHENLKNLISKIEALPEVKEYLESDEYKKIRFITAHLSNWGNRNHPEHVDL